MAPNGILSMLGLPATLLMMPGFYAVSQTAPADDHQDPAFRLSVDVNLVVLHATVRDRKADSPLVCASRILRFTKTACRNTSGCSSMRTFRSPSDW